MTTLAHPLSVLFEAFKGVLPFLRDVWLWWFCLFKDIVNSSPDSVFLLSVELSGGDNLRGRDVRRSYGKVQPFLQQG